MGAPQLFKQQLTEGGGELGVQTLGWAGQGVQTYRGTKGPHTSPLLPCQESSCTELVQNYQLSSTVEPTTTAKYGW